MGSAHWSGSVTSLELLLEIADLDLQVNNLRGLPATKRLVVLELQLKHTKPLV